MTYTSQPLPDMTTMYPVESESGASRSPYDDDDVTIFTVMLPSALQSTAS